MMRLVKSMEQRGTIIFSCVLFVLPAIVLGVFSYYKVFRILEEKANTSNLQLISNSQSNIERTLKIIEKYYTTLAESSQIKSYLNREVKYSNSADINEMQSIISDPIYSSEDLIKNVYLINVERGWVVDNTGFEKFHEFIDRKELFDILSSIKKPSWFYSELEINERLNVNLGRYIPKNSIAMVIPISLASEKITGAIIININKNAINGFIEGVVKGGRMIILDNRYHVIDSSDKRLISEDLSYASYISEIKTNIKPQGKYISSIDSRKAVIVFNKSGYNNWAYIATYFVDELKEEVRAIGWLVASGAMVIAILSMFFITLGWKKRFNSICGEAELLIEQRSKLDRIMEKQSLQLEEFVLYKLFYREVNDREIQKAVSTLSYASRWNRYLIMVIQVSCQEETKDWSREKGKVLSAIKEIICTIIKVENRSLPISDKGVLFTLLGCSDDRKEELRKLASLCWDKVEKEFAATQDIRINMGISRSFNDVNEFKNARLQSMDALMHSVRSGNNGGMSYEEISSNLNTVQSFSVKIEEEFIASVKCGNINRTERLLGELIDETFKGQLTYCQYQIAVIRLFSDIVRIMQDSGVMIGDLIHIQRALQEETYGIMPSKQIKEWFMKKMIIPLIEVCERQESNEEKELVKYVIDLIHEEYNKDLTLEKCAERLKCEPNFLWRVFLKNMDISFGDYVSRYRLELAKKWLEDTDISIGEIAKRLNYNNSQNFIRFFKKNLGMTPGKYRESL